MTHASSKLRRFIVVFAAGFLVVFSAWVALDLFGYEEALPYLVAFYGAIAAISDTPFDPNRAAELELEWWIVHREGKTFTGRSSQW